MLVLMVRVSGPQVILNLVLVWCINKGFGRNKQIRIRQKILVADGATRPQVSSEVNVILRT